MWQKRKQQSKKQFSSVARESSIDSLSRVDSLSIHQSMTAHSTNKNKQRNIKNTCLKFRLWTHPSLWQCKRIFCIHFAYTMYYTCQCQWQDWLYNVESTSSLPPVPSFVRSCRPSMPCMCRRFAIFTKAPVCQQPGVCMFYTLKNMRQHSFKSAQKSK